MEYKIVIICGLIIGIIITIMLIFPTQNVITVAIIVVSIIITFLALAYYEEQQEKAE